VQAPEAILFDLWGTLITSDAFDPERGHAAVLRCCDNPRGVTPAEVQELGDRVVTEVQGREEQSVHAARAAADCRRFLRTSLPQGHGRDRNGTSGARPSPCGLSTACGSCSRKRRAWFAGDNVTCDVAGAGSAGIYPVAFRPSAAVPAAVGKHSVITGGPSSCPSRCPGLRRRADAERARTAPPRLTPRGGMPKVHPPRP